MAFAAAAAPAPPQPPALIDPTSPEFHKELAREQAAALAGIAKTKPNRSRRFVVGWEMHSGYFFTLPNDPAAWVTPDFLNPQILALFDETNRSAAEHVGQRLVCDCVGADWTFYSSERFLIREAKLAWERP